MNAHAQLEKRYTLAQAKVEAADEAFAAESAVLLQRLLGRSPEQRFAALEAEAKNLTDGDRRALLRSLQGGAQPARQITAATASPWAVWRSRLPYNVVPLAIGAFSILLGIALLWVAVSRTPDRVAIAVVKSDTAFRWQLPGGGTSADVIRPGQRYTVVQTTRDKVLIRGWVAGTGYAHAEIPAEWLQAP